MKKLLLAVFLLPGIYTQAQIGIGTTSPNSTLDVRGALSLNFRVFTGTTTPVSSTDNTIVFTGTLASTATLPDATTCIGRMYRVKNASTTIPTPLLTIATTASQTIDGLSTWVLDEGYGSMAVVSNGTNWLISSQSAPKSSGSAWVEGGNTVSAVKKLGTISNYDLPFITNNTEKIRLTATGNLGIGTSTFNGTYPERLIVDAGATGNTNYQNVIVGKGNTNSYAQLNIQNTNAGTAASSDVVATSNTGSEVKYYVDMGINSSGNTQNFFGDANDAYLYAQGDTAVANTTGGNLYIGTSLPSRDVAFLTGGGTKSSGVAMNNERMRILSTGNVGINTNTPTEKLDITGNLKFSGAFMPGGTAGTAGFFLMSMGAGVTPVWFDANSLAWQVNGNTETSEKTLGTAAGSNFALPFITNGTERMRISNSGNVAIGTSAFSGTFPEHLLVNAASPVTITDYQNVIVGKGNTNSYAQLNIQNMYSAAANSASSDVVATSDNGNESVNYIDMGINSGTNTTTGVYGGGNTAYLYSTGNDFAFGNATASKNLLFFTGGTASANERMRINGSGNVGIGITNPTAVLHLKAGTAAASTAPLKFTSGTKLTTAEAGAMEYDGVNTYITNETTSGRGAIPVEQHFLLTAAGGAITTIANYFGTTSNIPLVSGAYYEIDIYCSFVKTTASTIVWTFTNSAAPTSMDLHYEFSGIGGIVATADASELIGDQDNLTTTAPTITTGSLATGVTHYAHFKILLLNGTGTSLKIQATSTAGSITPGLGSRWYRKRISTTNVGAFAN